MALYKKGFMGNEKIRSSGIAIEWDQDKLAEFKRCSEDPEYFISHYVWILNLDSEKLVLFEPRRYQIEMIKAVVENRFVISKWGRQMGKSVIASALLLWFIIFHSNFPVLILAHKHDKAREILAVIESMYENLPEWLQHGVKTWSKGTIELENGSLIKTAGTSSSSGRGGAYQIIFLDEMAFVPTHIADTFLKSVVPTISSGKSTKIIITSTPKGLNTFYRIWSDSVNGKNEYVRVDVNWWEAPGRDEEFKRKTIEAYGEDFWQQEFESAFLGSSRTLISGNKLMSIATIPPLRSSESSRVYADPQEGRQYAATVDVSEGLGADSSAVVVVDITELPYTVAMVYQNNLVEPMALPGIVAEIARSYNDALVLVESNFGAQVGEILWSEYEYENLVFTSKGKTGVFAKQDRIGVSSPRSRVGIAWNAHSKRVGCTNLKTLVESDQLMIQDSGIYDELTHFVVSKKSYAADSGHDDLAMCLVMFGWLVDQGYVRDATGTSARNRVRELREEVLEREMMPLGFNSTRMEEAPIAIEFRQRPAIDLPADVDDLSEGRWNDLFQKEAARGGKSEMELHADFMKKFFGFSRDDVDY